MTRRPVTAARFAILSMLIVPLVHAQPRRSELGTARQQSRVRTSREADLLPLQAACNVNVSRELFITDLSVVEDCFRTTYSPLTCATQVQPATRGAWTFGKLLEGIFGTTDPATLSTMTLQFLHELTIPHTLNGEVVAARPEAQDLLIDSWLLGGNGQLDMKRAPFQLNAIVARLDLRQNGNGSTTPTGGQLHFVYQFTLSDHFPSQAFFIFEYNLDAADCAGILDWANRFHALGGIPFGKNYNAALQAITDKVTKINASPGRPNGSSIKQVRSNELQFGPGWQQRQFMLTPTGSGTVPLLQTTVPQTPAIARQGSAEVAAYVNANAASIIAGTNTVPLTVNGVPFLGGVAPNQLNLKWDGPSPACSSIPNKDARAAFSANTCNGCHGPETGTSFKQVLRRNPGMASLPSGFLKGITLTDMCGVSRTYNDLERRRVDLCQLLNSTCSQVNAEPPINFVH